MNRIHAWLVCRISRALGPEEREALLGDFAELKMHGSAALWELLGLVARRQLAPWRGWRPWLAFFGVAGLSGILLTRTSFGLSWYPVYQLHFLRKYGTFYRNGLSATDEIVVFACQALAVVVWSWVAGFTLGSLSRPAPWINLFLFYLVCFLFWPPRHLVLSVLRGSTLDTALTLTLEAILFLLPSIWGMYRGVRRDNRPMPDAVWWAAAVITMTVLATWTSGWRQDGLRALSGGTWPHTLVNWESRLLPFALMSWPAGYLLVIASRQRWQRRAIAG